MWSSFYPHSPIPAYNQFSPLEGVPFCAGTLINSVSKSNFIPLSLMICFPPNRPSYSVHPYDAISSPISHECRSPTHNVNTLSSTDEGIYGVGTLKSTIIIHVGP